MIEDKLPEGVVESLAAKHGVTPQEIGAIGNDEVTRRAHEATIISHDTQGFDDIYDDDNNLAWEGDHYSNFLHD